MGNATRWTYAAGEKGCNRVRAYERDSGIIYLEFSEGGERRRFSTRHRNREKAKRQAEELAVRLRKLVPKDGEDVTLGMLFEKYVRERSPEVNEQRQVVHRRVREAMCRYFGSDREVASLNRRDWDGYTRDRREGMIDARGNEVEEASRRPVGARAVREDLEVLRAACNWAVQADLLDGNPTGGYPLPREGNPTRPRLSEDRYRAMLGIASEVDWRFRLALVLANETGHRSKAIRRLRWSDVDLEGGLVRWRAEEDKTGHEHVTPLTEVAVDALHEAQRERPAVGDAWIFPAPKDEAQPCSRNIFRDWWYRAEGLADLERVEGLGWHGLRRKFADELRDAPLKDLATLGGWKEERTILQCYQGPSLESMREAQAQRRVLQDRASSE